MSVFASHPGDFEKQSAIILGCNELLPFHPQILVDLVSILVNRIPILAIVNNEDQRRNLITLLCDWGLPAHLLHYVSMPVKGMWVRDYGPMFVRNQKDGITINDAEYLELDRPYDDMAPTSLANLLKVPVVKVPLLLEGGNILSNGKGLCVTTDTLFSRNEFRQRDQRKVVNLLDEYYGFHQIVMLKPLLSEPTGHVDMFATFVAHDVVIVGQYDPKTDPVNADILNENASILQQVRVDGKPLTVLRIPMPSNMGSIWRTYTNCIFANGIVVVPTYSGINPDIERRAMATYASALKDWEIVGIDASTVIIQRGSLRCISINIPWLDDRFVQTPARSEEIRTRFTPASSSIV
jgi:agmatine/peptidylarginine deiminase